MKTHYGYESTYDPYGEDTIEKHYCGTYAAENYEVTKNKEYITCKKCLNKYDKFVKSDEENEKIIVKQMGDMAKWWDSQKLVNNVP